MKRCSNCGVEKAINNFMKKERELKQCPECRLIHSNYMKEFYKNNSDKLKEKSLNYHHSHKETISERSKNYREENKEILSEKHKKYYENNKNELNKKMKVYAKSSIEVILKNKIKNYKQRDIHYNRQFNDDDYVSIEYVNEMLTKCNNRCSLCSIELKLTNFEKRDNQQFSIDRLDNKIAHIKSNIQITCLGCNQHKH